VGIALIDTRLPHLSPDRLQALFHELNGQFFRGRLPKYSIRVGQSPKANRASGYCDSESQTIFLDPNPPTFEETRRVLLHEMCHIGCPWHGVKFQKKLRALAVAGEQWAEAEADKYAEGNAQRRREPVTAEIARRLKDMALEGPEAGWPAALRVLAFEVGLPEGELARIAPWAPTLWATETAARRADKEQNVS
jgi:hypothetical protein